MKDRLFWFLVVLTVLAVAGPAAYWLFGPEDRLYTYGPSMNPTMRGIDEVNVDFEAYDRARPRAADIVALQGPPEEDIWSCAVRPRRGSACDTPPSSYTGEFLIKRVVAEPGDRLAVARDGRVILNGRRLAEPYVRPCDARHACWRPRPIRIPAGHYYVMGDNRPNSTDSRIWGPVALSAIDGRVRLEN